MHGMRAPWYPVHESHRAVHTVAASARPASGVISITEISVELTSTVYVDWEAALPSAYVCLYILVCVVRSGSAFCMPDWMS